MLLPWKLVTFGVNALLVHGAVLPPPTGPYNVGAKEYVLKHTTPNDGVSPNNTGTALLIGIYYPTNDPATPQKYIWDGLGASYGSYYGLPGDAFTNITANIAYNATPLSVEKRKKIKLPTIFFGPAAAGPPSRMNTGVISELASRGYVVVSIDHPYEQPYVEFPDGTGFPGKPLDWAPTDLEMASLLEYRVTDNSVVLDALPRISKKLQLPLNLTHFAFFGHSIGGAISLAQGNVENSRSVSNDKTFLGGINIDGGIVGPAGANDATVDMHTPSLLIASSGHLPEDDHSWPIFQSFQTAWTKHIRVQGKSNHSDFADVIFLKHEIGISGGGEAITAERMLEITRRLVVDFFTMLVGGGEGILTGGEDVEEGWPEVAFVFNGTGDPCVPDLCESPGA